MADMGKVRQILEAVRIMAVHLTDDEISEIGLVLYKATLRLEKEGNVE